MATREKSSSITWPWRRGFTMVELLIGIAAVALIFIIAGPNFSGMIQSHYLKSTSDQLLTSISLAQSEAARRHSTVRICPSSDGLSCRSDDNWNYGWVIFTDGNGNGLPDRIEILETYAAPSDRIRIKASGAFTGIASFSVAGLIRNNDSDVGVFRICPKAPNSGSRTVTVQQDGSMRLTKTNNLCTAG